MSFFNMEKTQMAKQLKLTGIICIIACLLCIIWGMINMAYMIPNQTPQYRFDGVRAANGTVFAVKEGRLDLISGSNFSADRPLRRFVNLCLWGLCFLMTLLSGVIFLRLVKKEQRKDEMTAKGRTKP
jgi:CDP-diglyceride synthetase